jgi:hypothetical protein
MRRAPVFFLALLLLGLVSGCTRSACVLREGTDWHGCEQNLMALRQAILDWRETHGGRLPDRLSELVLPFRCTHCPYSGFAYGYWPDPPPPEGLGRRALEHRAGRPGFRLICRGWAHRVDLGDVNLVVDAQAPDFASFSAAPVPPEWQDEALERHPGGVVSLRHNSLLLVFLAGVALTLGLRQIAGLPA